MKISMGYNTFVINGSHFALIEVVGICIAYACSVVILIHGLNDRQHWIHVDGPPGGWGRIGSVIGIVFFLPLFGGMLLVDRIFDGKVKIVILSILGLSILIMTPVVMIGVAKRKGIFHKIP